MENSNQGESSSTNEHIRSRIELLPKPQLVEFLCKLASQHPAIAQELETLTTVHEVTLHRKLFVRPLSSTTNSQTLRHAFQEYGEIEEAVVIHDRVTKISKNYGFIIYKDIKSVTDALREPRKTIDGVVAVCRLADEPKTSSDPDIFLRRKLYIGDLPTGVTSENLRSYFRKHGEIEDAFVIGRYGFVTFATAEDAKKAIDYNTLNPTYAEGRKRIVKYAHARRGRLSLRRAPSPEHEQSENAYVDSPPPYPRQFTAHSPYPRVNYAMTDRFGNQYYYDYSHPYQ